MSMPQMSRSFRRRFTSMESLGHYMIRYVSVFCFLGALAWSYSVLRPRHMENRTDADMGMDPLLAIKRYHQSVEKEMPDPETLELVPSCSRVVMYHDQKGNGLGAQVLRVFDAYLLAYKMNATLLIARQMFWNYGCDLYITWECYFDPLTPYCVGLDGELRRVDTMVSPDSCDIFRIDSYQGERCMHIADSIAEDQLYHLVHDDDKKPIDEVFDNMKRFVRNVWKPNKSIRDNTQDSMRQMNLIPGQYVGLHIRRGDKALEVPLIPLEDYAHAVKISGSNATTIFLATDDGSILWELKQLLPGYKIFTFADPSSTGHLQRTANEAALRGTVLSTMSLVAEIDILRQAEYFIGTYSSNIGRLLAVLRDRPTETSISMDVSWSPGVAWRSFNTEYCKGTKFHKAFCEWKETQNIQIDDAGFYF
mmetsp:Transcript_1057/g.3282  ORF Transcript_1057/g.3282 Transcript_1057/m.3282 type:complete len:421 (-) Transcript_1057:100-1362(-)